MGRHKGDKLTLEHKNNIRLAFLGNKNHFFGKKHTEEARKKMSDIAKKREFNPMLGKHHTDETKNKISEKRKIAIKNNANLGFIKGNEYYKHANNIIHRFVKGNIPHNLGKRWSEETKRKIGDIAKYEYSIGKRIPSLLGKHHSNKTKMLIAEKVSIARHRGCYCQKPNKPELFLLDLITKNNFALKYVGDGKVYFKGNTHYFNPDFINEDSKCIIEIFGSYWHNIPNAKIKDKERLITYQKHGYKTLVLWEHELYDKQLIIKRIEEFLK
jgi:G:T-mismatch repair DNA endonuclease (very short patch repair protein)